MLCRPVILNLLSLLSTRLLCLLHERKSNPFVVAVSPLKALISDQLESCQTLKFKAVKMKMELFDNDDKLKELEVLFS